VNDDGFNINFFRHQIQDKNGRSAEFSEQRSQESYMAALQHRPTAQGTVNHTYG
jgi:hypothetical protein